ncbi:hypothetical protein FB451DRAFT_1053026 [Mycena latifolia]|nr:hypothetical protein FB451DRAFT_1053026 [Mycena latifolia]
MSSPTLKKWDARSVLTSFYISFSLAFQVCWACSWPVPHDLNYYSKCMLGGALACGITHAGITPLDVAKCNMQVGILAPLLCLSFHFILSYTGRSEVNRLKHV